MPAGAAQQALLTNHQRVVRGHAISTHGEDLHHAGLCHAGEAVVDAGALADHHPVTRAQQATAVGLWWVMKGHKEEPTAAETVALWSEE